MRVPWCSPGHEKFATIITFLRKQLKLTAPSAAPAVPAMPALSAAEPPDGDARGTAGGGAPGSPGAGGLAASVVAVMTPSAAAAPLPPLFVYVNGAFCPSPVQSVADLFRCFGRNNELQLNYSTQEAWG